MFLLTPDDCIVEQPKIYMREKELLERDKREMRENKSFYKEKAKAYTSRKTSMIASSYPGFSTGYDHQEFLMKQFNNQFGVDQFYETAKKKKGKKFRIKNKLKNSIRNVRGDNNAFEETNDVIMVQA